MVSHRTLLINLAWEVHYGANPICVRYYKEVGSPPVFLHYRTEHHGVVVFTEQSLVVRSSVGRKLGF